MKLSGYHWAILLAPKDVPLSTSEDRDSIRWDITNEDNPTNNWRFRRAPVNQYLSVSLCARILLAKFDRNDRESTLLSVGNMLESIEIKQSDPTFTCRVWVLSAVQTLEENGLIKLKLPPVGLEASVTVFGDKCMRDIQSRKVDIAEGGISAIPVLDLRSMK
jgi:hypothetical protein